MSLMWINLDNFWYDFGDSFNETSIIVWSKRIRGLLKISVTIAKKNDQYTIAGSHNNRNYTLKVDFCRNLGFDVHQLENA